MVKSRVTRGEARSYRKRWKTVNAAERKELRSAPFALKFRQMAALMASARELGWMKRLAAGKVEVRNRWNRLRKALGD